ncbi:MAG: fimbrillin family protein [Alistipes sp.]|nr:fimbrillin family protein [Alistipes sp.]
MKKILLAALALGALVSCSKDELISESRQAIEFGNAFVDNSTRATSATDPSYYTNGTEGFTQLTSFNVYGTVGSVNIFNGVTINKGDAAYGVAWTQNGGNTQYWIPGASYVFDAVVDATDVTTNASTGLPTSLKYNVAEQKDMLHDRVEVPSAAENQGVVTFEFTHLLSKVKFTVVNKTAANATNYRYVIKDAKLTTVYTEGNYAVPEATWSNQVDGQYALDAELIVNSNATEYNANEVLLIPGSAVGVSLTAELQATADGGTNWTTVATYPKTFTAVLGEGNELEANHAYNFILEVSVGNPIQFTATILPDWENGNTTPTDAPTYVPVD